MYLSQKLKQQSSINAVENLRLRSHDAGTFWKRWKIWRLQNFSYCSHDTGKIWKRQEIRRQKLVARLWCQRSVPKNPKNRSVAVQKWLKCSVFVIFKCLWWCRWRFQNLPVRVPFRKSTVFKICRKKYAVFVWSGGLSENCWRLHGIGSI